MIQDLKTNTPLPSVSFQKEELLRGKSYHLKEMGVSEEDQRKFWSKVKTGENHECWNWIARRDPKGYGRVWLLSKHHGSHRIAFFAAGGKCSNDKPFVIHSCSNPSCVNPLHLRAGDAKDNAWDMVLADRHTSGERNGNAKLTWKKVNAIRSKYRRGISPKEIKGTFGIAERTLWDILDYRTWKRP